MLRSEGEFEAMRGLIGEPGPGFLGDVRGMIVEDQLDRRVERIGGIEELEEFDEFAAAMTIPDQGVGSRGLCRNPKHPDESPRNDNFHGIGRLGG